MSEVFNDVAAEDVVLAPQTLVEDKDSTSKYALKVRRRISVARRQGSRGVPPFPILGMENRSDKAIQRSRHQRPPHRRLTTPELAKQWSHLEDKRAHDQRGQ